MMNLDDEQTLRDMRHFTRELLKHADALPAGLVTMLRDYETDLSSPPSPRWAGIGDAGESESLAARLAQRMTDGRWPGGTPLDDSANDWQLRSQTPANVDRTLRLLADRGEVTLRNGTYYPRRPDDSP